MNLVRSGLEPIKFMSSAETSPEKNLLSVKYRRAQKESPDFATIFDSIDQSVEATISTVIFRTAPEPVLTLYDFVMTTFVPKSEPPPTNAIGDVRDSDALEEVVTNASSSSSGKIRVIVKLASVQSQ